MDSWPTGLSWLEPLSVTLGIGLLLVGAIGQRGPVGVSAKRIELEDPNVNLPEAIVLAPYGYPLLVELWVEVHCFVVFHDSNIARFVGFRKGADRTEQGGLPTHRFLSRERFSASSPRGGLKTLALTGLET